MSAYDVAKLSDLDAIGSWVPIRKHFDIGAFGVNVWRGDDGVDLVGEHDETLNGHEELYLVLEGRATFSVGEDEVDAPAGTAVFVRDPAVRRKAVARENGTSVIAVGATRGAAYAAPAWEWNAEALPLFGSGDYEGARTLLLRGLEVQPDAAGILYNLACAQARLGNEEEAFDYLLRAVERFPRFAEFAQSDDDLASLRDDPRFPAGPVD